MLRLWLLGLLGLRLLGFVRILRPAVAVVVHVVVVVVVAVLVVAILVVAALIALGPFLHLRLGSGNDPIVVLGMLQVVFRHDPVAGTLGVAGKRRIFFGNVLSRTTDLHVWAGTVIGAGKWIAALAVEVVAAAATAVVVGAAAPSTALVLLSWPHRSFT